MKIGVIAEETNDVDVLYQLTSKLIDESSFSFKKFVGHGCGKLRLKCSVWADNLIRRGCSYLVVLHDLDERVEADLRSELSKAVSHAPYDAYFILIPVREIEAWLLSDAKALKTVFNLPKVPTLPSNPEAVVDPKKKLTDVVWASGRKHYINTIHNKKIAAKMSISKAKKCESFKPYSVFVKNNLMSRTNKK